MARRQRPIEVRMAEAEEKLDRLKAQKAIRDMQEKLRSRTPRRRRRT